MARRKHHTWIADNLPRGLSGQYVDMARLGEDALGLADEAAYTLYNRGATRHEQITWVIGLYTQRTHSAPSRYQIAVALGVNEGTVKTYLARMQLSGLITLIDGHIRLTGALYIPPIENE